MAANKVEIKKALIQRLLTKSAKHMQVSCTKSDTMYVDDLGLYVEGADGINIQKCESNNKFDFIKIDDSGDIYRNDKVVKKFTELSVKEAEEVSAFLSSMTIAKDNIKVGAFYYHHLKGE